MRTLKNIHIDGVIGDALKISCENRLKQVDYLVMAQPFLYWSEDDNAWRCEFWGKVIRSAILTNRWLNDKVLAEKIRGGIEAILAAQTSDGCISSYPEEKQCGPGGWDVWGRKYVLLGLLRYYECCGHSPEVLDAACRLVDHLFKQLQERGRQVSETGCHGGLAACSIRRKAVPGARGTNCRHRLRLDT